MKYVSIDIETTGLDPATNQIVEIGAVIDELGSTEPHNNLPKFRAVLIHEHMMIGSYCAYLHRILWKEIGIALRMYGDQIKEEGYYFEPTSGVYYLVPEKFEWVFHRWLNDMMGLGIEYFSDTGEPLHGDTIKINVAGKNPGSFDIPFIEALPGWQGLVKFRRRVLDPASYFIREGDEHIPDLQECLKRMGVTKTVSHTAVDDALDIVNLIRYSPIGLK
jgi:hypothetical protein